MANITSRASSSTSRSRTPEPPRTYEEARERLKTGVTRALETIAELPTRKKLKDEVVLCLFACTRTRQRNRTTQRYFLRTFPTSKKVGSRMYRERASNVAATPRTQKRTPTKESAVEGRIVFVQSSPSGFQRFLRHLDSREKGTCVKVRETKSEESKRFDTLTAERAIRRVRVGLETQQSRAHLASCSSRRPSVEVCFRSFR